VPLLAEHWAVVGRARPRQLEEAATLPLTMQVELETRRLPFRSAVQVTLPHLADTGDAAGAR
jgi:hypothetical protein